MSGLNTTLEATINSAPKETATKAGLGVTAIKAVFQHLCWTWNIWCLNIIHMFDLVIALSVIVYTNRILLNLYSAKLLALADFLKQMTRLWSYILLPWLVNNFAEKNDLLFMSFNWHKFLLLYIDKGGSILTWNTQTWERMASKHIIRDPISAFNVSADGKFLAWYIF